MVSPASFLVSYFARLFLSRGLLVDFDSTSFVARSLKVNIYLL